MGQWGVEAAGWWGSWEREEGNRGGIPVEFDSLDNKP